MLGRQMVRRVSGMKKNILVFILFLQWTVFCLGYYLQFPFLQSQKSLPLLLSPLIYIVVWLLVNKHSVPLRKIWDSASARHFEQVNVMAQGRLYLWVFLSAALSLFAEMAVIRFHSSVFQIFAFFKNLSLLSCFLGLGIGFARGERYRLLTPLTIPAFSFQFALLLFLQHARIEPFLANLVPDQVAFGLSPVQSAGQIFVTYGFISFFFFLNALCFIPLGQLAGFFWAKSPKLPAYSFNLLGSMVGIGLLVLLSFLNTPIEVWVIVLLALLFFFLRKDPQILYGNVVVALILLVILSGRSLQDQIVVYSPYQILELKIKNDRNFPYQLKVSHTFFQNLLDLRAENIKDKPFLQQIQRYYQLPYVFKPVPGDVLIVGSGTGNDVASALRFGAKQIDAVEIDPVILNFGRLLHPERPYAQDNVSTHIVDARTFLRSTSKKYDLIVFGLLDSHGTLSGSSNVRLDNFVYTLEAFRDARARLKADGCLFLALSLGKGEAVERIVAKVGHMLKQVFDGRDPIIFKTDYDEGYTFVIGEEHFLVSSYGQAGFDNIVKDVFAAHGRDIDLSSDDWPFLFMPKRKYPLSYLFIFIVLLLLSRIFVKECCPDTGAFSWPCFFLGAGFMLLETKAITQLGLLFGSTWLVVSVTVLAILILAFAANVILIKKKSLPPRGIYVLLLLSLLCWLWPFSTDNLTAEKILLPLVLTLPVFFAGFAFSSELKAAKSVESALSANLFGAMFGGFWEYHSMWLGFRALTFFALFIYAAAFLSSLLKSKA